MAMSEAVRIEVTQPTSPVEIRGQDPITGLDRSALANDPVNGPGLGVDPLRLAVAGDDVGGNIAAAVTLMAKQRRGPRIEFQALFYPVMTATFEASSYRTFAAGPWLTRAAMQSYWDAYLPGPGNRMQITATPGNASLEQLRGLPEALIIVAENDVLRDEGEAYARDLSAAGVRVTSLRYNGTIHDFVVINALADTRARCHRPGCLGAEDNSRLSGVRRKLHSARRWARALDRRNFQKTAGA
jgi:acetyl esterase/lipase